jgi:glucokinase
VQHVIGVDLGGSKIEIGVVDESGKVLHHVRLETLVKDGPQVVENQIIEGIRYLQLQTELPIQGIGVGVAGQTQSKTGIVHFAPNLKWTDYPLGAHLAEEIQLPVFLVNDVRAITWGEWLFGAGKGCENLICLFIGTGIGSGIVVDNHLLMGCSETCGEVGHMTIDFQGSLCTCGNRGCLETLAGGWGITAQAKKAMQLDHLGNLSENLLSLAGDAIENVTARLVIEAYHQGDRMAQLVIHKALDALIAGCTSLVNAFNPCRLILGGGVVNGLPEWISAVEQGINKWALKAAIKNFEVVPAQLGQQVGVIGSAAVAFNHLNSNPLLPK